MSRTDQPWPHRLRFQKGAAQLVVEYDDGETAIIPYTRLRAESPSAAVRGHGSGPKPPQPPVPADIQVTAANPIGRYAVQIVFSDGHDSGYYTWAHLRALGETGQAGPGEAEGATDSPSIGPVTPS